MHSQKNNKLNSFEKDGVVYYQLYCSCPVCFERGNTMPQSYWVHGNDDCGGDLYIGNNANIMCSKCGEVKFETYWTFACPNHTKNCDYEVAFLGSNSIYGFPRGVFCGVGHVIQATGTKWMQDYLYAFVNNRH